MIASVGARASRCGVSLCAEFETSVSQQKLHKSASGQTDGDTRLSQQPQRDSPVRAYIQVFLMLTSVVSPFNSRMTKATSLWTILHDGKKFNTEGLLAGMKSGLCLHSRHPSHVSLCRHVVPSQDGSSIFYVKSSSTGIFAQQSGLNRELVFKSSGGGISSASIIPDGKDPARSGRRAVIEFPFYRINVPPRGS